MTEARWQIWLGAMRPRTLPAAVAPVLVGSALAWRDHAFDGVAAGLCLGFALLIQIGTNFANDYYDFLRGADNAARVGPRRAVAAGLISPAAMRVAVWVIFAAAFVLGLSLVKWGGPWLLIIGVTSIVCGIAYTGGPWPLAYHGLGDVFVFVFFGLVAVGATYFVQAGRMTAGVLVAAVPIGLLATNILVVNNYRDAETDAAAKKRTLVVRFGRGAARAQFNVSLALAFLMPIAFVVAERSFWCALPCALAPTMWRHARRLEESKSPSELIELLGDTGRLLAFYAVLFSAGLVL